MADKTLDQATLNRIPMLHPAIRDEVEAIYRNEVFPALAGRASFRIASTLRTWEEQDSLYAQGRTAQGPRVTNARAGDSWHNYGLAFDIVLAGVNDPYSTTGDFDSDSKADWMEAIEIFKRHGYSWGGDWNKFKDLPHLEKTFGVSLKEAKKRYQNGDFIPGTKYIRIDGQKSSYTAPPPEAKATAVIGDDIGLALGNKYTDRIDTLADYCKSGWGADDLDKALKNAPKKDYTKVVVSIGAKDLWEKTGNFVTNVLVDPRRSLIRRITEAFPKAELYILNGYFGTGSLAANSECNPDCWAKKIRAYTLYFEDSKFKVIGQVKNFNGNAWTNDELIAGFADDLTKYGIIAGPAAQQAGGGGGGGVVEQPTSRGEYNSSTTPAPPSQKNQLSSDGIVNLFQATILPTTIKIKTPDNDLQKKEFVEGLGYSPIVYYNSLQVDSQDIFFFSIYYDGLLPHINIYFSDSLGVLKDSATPMDNSKITVFISSRNDYLRPIHIDFKVKTYVNEGGYMNIVAALDVNGLYYSTYKSYPNFTSNFLLQQLCKDVGLGFNTNIVETNDAMTWMSTGEKVYDFMQDVLEHAYISDSSFISGNIDLYYNLNFVDIQKELARDVGSDLAMSDEAIQKARGMKESGQKSPMFLSNDEGFKMSSFYFSGYRITNRATDIALEEGYGDHLTYYDTSGKSEASFSVDSMNLNTDRSLALKSPNDDEFFEANRKFVYGGKANRDNSHVNYNYSDTHNDRNILEADKLLMEVEVPLPNFNLYRFQKIKVVFSHQAKSPSAEMVNSRFTGDWMIADIRFLMTMGRLTQLVTLVKRELELTEEEVKAGVITKPRPSGRGGDDYRGSYDNPPAGSGGQGGQGGGQGDQGGGQGGGQGDQGGGGLTDISPRYLKGKITKSMTFEEVTAQVILNLEGGYYHPNMLADGRVKDKRYGKSGETMYGLDRMAGGPPVNACTPCVAFWKLLDDNGASKTWRWNYIPPDPLKTQLLNLAVQIMKGIYERNLDSYLPLSGRRVSSGDAQTNKEIRSLIQSDGRLQFNFVYASWNGPGWFQQWSREIKSAYNSGKRTSDELAAVFVGLRVNSKNSLIAQGGAKISQLVGIQV